MLSENTAVFGIYGESETAGEAVEYLLTRGFNNSEISFLLPDNKRADAFGNVEATQANEETVAVVAASGVIGGTLGFFAGLVALAIPGVGSLIATGPILVALAGAGAGTAGGMVSALIGAGLPEFEAKSYESAIKAGAALISVHCNSDEQVHLAQTGLEKTGARDIALAGQVTEL